MDALRAGVEPRNVEQAVEQLLRRAQGGVDALADHPDFGVDAGPRAQSGGEQAGRIERLQQIVAGGGDEAGLGLVGCLGGELGDLLGSQRGGELTRALDHPLFQPLGGLAQFVFNALVVGDVGEGHQIPTARQRRTAALDHPPIRPFTQEHVRPALPQMPDPALHEVVDLARAEQPALGVESDQAVDRATDVEQLGRILEQLGVAAVPGHQPLVAVDHRDALRHVLEGRSEQRARKAQFLRGLVEQRGDLVQLHAAAAQGRGQHQARRRRADRAGQHAFDVLQQGAVGGGLARQGAPGGARVLLERSQGRVFAEDAGREVEQVADRGAPGEPRVRIRRRTARNEKRARPEALAHRRAAPARDHGECSHVGEQRPQGAMGHRVQRVEAEQRLRTQPADAERPVGQPGGGQQADPGQGGQEKRV